MTDYSMKNREPESVSFDLSAILTLLRIKNQYGTLLVLMPALWSLFIASEGKPDLILLFIVIFGAFLMRSAGCAINDIADRNFDPHIERTKNRPLAAGKLTLGHGIVTFFCIVIAAALLTIYLNLLAIMLSVVCLVLVIIYPFAKRVVSFPQLFLGIAFGWGSVIVWAAVKNEIELAAYLIFLSTVTWAVAYDTVYAMMDIDGDIKIGVKSTAILFGNNVKPVVGLLFASTVFLLAWVGIISDLGVAYFLSLIVCCFIFFIQIHYTEPGMNKDVALSCFKSNVVAGCIVLAGIVLDYLA